MNYLPQKRPVKTKATALELGGKAFIRKRARRPAKHHQQIIELSGEKLEM